MVARARAAGGGAVGIVEIKEIEAEVMYQAARTVGRKRGPYRITDEFLAVVLGQERTGGVKLVMKENDVSERTARRWLRQAGERGLR